MATSGSSDGGGGDGPQFLTSGSSALILSFLAIGLFVGGLLVMLAMRRYIFLSRRRAGRWDPDNDAGTWNWADPTYERPPPFAIGMGRSRRQRDFGEKPELFDLRIANAAGTDWQDIVPIGAQAIKQRQQDLTAEPFGSRDADHQQHATAISGYLHPFSVGVRDFVAQIRPQGRRVRARSPSPPPPLFSSVVSSPTDTSHVPSSSPSPNDAPATPAGPTHLRVAVTILMPGQQFCGGDVPLYALGVADIRWNGGPVDELRREEG
ncbi:hypothetical protein PYCCODRAFT_1432866 [Trametes coccinea BRFM310]|uniref:Uncharacterized protein n=1 Tax=Trametes coccinea (strain BRFM310) TaxID=1353009 RepID=A0A1Y2IVF8_TRAC3|nr:hypothetical protein PYCCODRAFT_1432866 [Trametes coccinea BRFM310]